MIELNDDGVWLLHIKDDGGIETNPKAPKWRVALAYIKYKVKEFFDQDCPPPSGWT